MAQYPNPSHPSDYRQRHPAPPLSPQTGMPQRPLSPHHPSQSTPYPRAFPQRRPHPQQGSIPYRSRRQPSRFLLAGGGMLALAALLVTPNRQPAKESSLETCQKIVQEQSILSRDELSALLTIDERSPKTAVREVIQEPYCVLSEVAIREGATAEREAYPLAFDPQTWFVVLYEGEEYAGYDFSFRR